VDPFLGNKALAAVVVDSNALFAEFVGFYGKLRSCMNYQMISLMHSPLFRIASAWQHAFKYNSLPTVHCIQI